MYPRSLTGDGDIVLQTLTGPSRLFTRNEVLARPSPVPAHAGIYGWFFRAPPSDAIDVSHCVSRHGRALLYVGIAPKPPPKNGRPPSRQTLRSRLRYHYRGNAAGSTLRLTLGCLLAAELDLELRRRGSGNRMTFGAGEARLSDWMAANAFVTWVVHAEPWLIEHEAFAKLDLPLNLRDNTQHAFNAQLAAIRAAAKLRARELPVA